MTLVQVFENSNLNFPDRVAIKGNDFSFTYSDFDKMTIAFASVLIKSGIKPGDYVGLCLERSAEMLIGIFGILRAGAAYLPVDSSQPEQRIRSLLNMADVSIVVTTNDLAPFIDALGYQSVIPNLKPEFKIIDSNLPVINPDDTAYVLFTSGSTGTPKGVKIAHSSVVNLIYYIQTEYPLNIGDVVLFKSPYTFDGSVWELFGWMHMGGTLCIAPLGVEKDPKQLWELIDKEKIAFLFFVPSMLHAFLEFNAYYKYQFNTESIKWVSVGGEVLPVPVVKRFYEIFGFDKVKLINVYGPTETTVYTTTHICSPYFEGDKIPIGKLVSNDTIYLLDENGELVPDGVEGEIYIGGAGVGKGYLGNDELNSEKFLHNRFLSKGLMYRTGDIGKKNTDGTYDFVGRKDFQVKLRGLRIEMGEIEYAFGKLAIIAECVVLMSKDKNKNDCIVAYIRINNDGQDQYKNQYALASAQLGQSIKTQLGKWLPTYMIPSYFIVCKTLPLTSHEKIDRKSLPSIIEFQIDTERQHFIPQTVNEEKLLEIWKNVLGLNTINEDDDFFVLGGHSLKAVQLISLVIKEFGIEVPLKDFYSGITLRSMLNAMEEKNYPVVSQTNDTLQIDYSATGYPLTPVQQEMWIMNNLDTSGLIHNIQIEFTIKGNVDIGRFKEAFKKTIFNEEIFNSAFVANEGVPYQQILNITSIDLPFTDISVLNSETKQRIYNELVNSNGKTLFDLTKLPLFSLKLVKYDENEYRLLMVVHHLIFDGWSLYLFIERLAKKYNNEPADKSRWRNVDYVHYLRSPRNLSRIEKEREYWTGELKNLPDAWSMPLQKDACFADTGKYGRRYWWTVDKHLSLAIEELALELRVTPFSVFMSAFQLSLAAFSGVSDVIVGTPFAGRNNENISQLIGYYTNMVCIRLSWNQEDTTHQLIQQCNQKAIGAFTNATIPFGELVKTIRKSAKMGKNPFYQAIMVLQNWPHEEEYFQGFSVEQREIGNDTAKTDFLLNIEKKTENYICWIEFDTMLYDQQISIRLVSAINYSLNLITQKQSIPIPKLSQKLKEIVSPPSLADCFIVGAGKLAAACIEILKSKDIVVHGVFTDDEWLQNRNDIKIHVLKEIKKGSSNFSQVDYIFSINNSEVLKTDFLKLAKKKTINYHDSPLPKFAGMYATNWAILRQSTVHGVSWHEITEEIDAGDLLSTEEVAVYENDTALSLNSRCFEASIKSFERLIDDIVNDTLSPVKQDLSERTYFPLAMRPENFGCFSPSMTAHEACSLIRATDFSPNFDNEFALPWLWVDQKLYIVADSEVLKVKGPPGHFANIQNMNGFYCKNGFLALHTVYNALLERIDAGIAFSAESKMTVPNHSYNQQAAAIFNKTARFEPFWRNEFKKANFVEWPFFSGKSLSGSYEHLIPDQYIQQIHQLFPDNNVSDVLSSMVALLLIRLADRTSGSMAIVPSDLNNLVGDNQYFSKWLPLSVDVELSQSIKNTISHLIGCIEKAECARSFVISLQLRYPSLRAFESSNPDIVINRSGNPLRNIQGKVNVLVSENSLIVNFSESKINVATDVFFTCFDLLIDQLLSNQEKPIQDVSLFDEDYAIELVNQGSSLADEKPVYKDVVRLLFEMAMENPDSIAVFEDGHAYSYRKFFSDIKLLTAKIKEQGAKEGDVVAIAIDRSYANMVSIMAILNCGACFLQVDTNQPESRIEFILNDSGTLLLLSNGNNKVSFARDRTLNVIIDSSDSSDSDESIMADLPDFDENLCAYIVYTSGSTGVPKGVVVTRRNLYGFIYAATNEYQIRKTDRILQFSNLTFDASIEEIFCAFCNGASLYLRTEAMLHPSELINYSISNAITVWDLPTAYWRQLIHSGEYENRLHHLHLRIVILGGEALYPVDVSHWSTMLPGHRLINTYGPTETTVVALTHQFRSDCSALSAVPIGRPFLGYQAFVINKSGMIVPPGIAGELVISGVGVAKGYLNAKETEEKVFRSIKLKNGIPNRCYYTGDKVYYNENGLVYFLGRVDNQLKIRGFRIEPSEIEYNLLSINEVSSCAVIADDSSGETRLIGFYSSISKKPVDYDLRSVLKGLLPSYMIPSEIIFIEKIPLTFNGKTNQKFLREIVQANKSKQINESEQPLGETELYILNLWNKIIGAENIGVNDDFFEIGGHSLNAISLMTAIKQEKGILVPLSALIQHPTVRKFSEYLGSKTQVNYWNCLVPIRTEGDQTPLFLIHGAGLNILLYQSLVKFISPNRPIYGFQASGLDGKKQIKETIEAMADEYVSEMQKIQPKGPYLLLGFSLGGFIAYEMSQLLTSKGFECRFTGMIDSVAYLADFSKSSFEKKLIRLWCFVVKPFYNLYLVAKEPSQSRSQLIKNKIKILKQNVMYYKSKFGAKHTGDLREEMGRFSFMSNVVLLHFNAALKKYKLKPANFHIDLIAAEKQTFYIFDREKYGWTKFARKGITKHTLPGEHSLMFAPPNDQLFAEILEKRLLELESLHKTKMYVSTNAQHFS